MSLLASIRLSFHYEALGCYSGASNVVALDREAQGITSPQHVDSSVLKRLRGDMIRTNRYGYSCCQVSTAMMYPKAN